MEKSSAAVIGAGMAGIGAAQILAAAGWRVVVFEKSRGLGGRCATKRWEGQTVDHGAQYFTMRNDEFSSAARAVCGPDLQKIMAPVVDGSGRVLPLEDRFYHVQGNSRVARALASGLDVRTGVAVDCSGARRIGGEDFDIVLSTAPWPQTAKLAGLPDLANPYTPCLAVLFLYEGAKHGLTSDCYAISDRSGHELAWSACENHKTGRIGAGLTAMVVHASEDFSREWLEVDPVRWSGELRGLLEDRWKIPSRALRAMHPHRWRYARVANEIEQPPLPDGWYFAGDLVSGSRVESAWLAGRATARRILAGA